MLSKSMFCFLLITQTKKYEIKLEILKLASHIFLIIINKTLYVIEQINFSLKKNKQNKTKLHAIYLQITIKTTS